MQWGSTGMRLVFLLWKVKGLQHKEIYSILLYHYQHKSTYSPLLSSTYISTADARDSCTP